MRMCAAVFAMITLPVMAYADARFDVRLVLDFESAEKTIELMEGLSGRPADIAGLRGSQIAMATTGLVAQQRIETSTLESSLQAIKYGQTPENDVMRMIEARNNLPRIKALLERIQSGGFAGKIVSTVQQLFPEGTALSTTIPVYFVAFGHPNIDGYVRRVVWQGNTPIFVPEGQGQVTIVVNLARAALYGPTVEDQFVGTLSVVAHEVFHAAFAVYKDNSTTWREYNATHRGAVDQMFDIVQNEGIAYYLSLIQRARGQLGTEGADRARAAVEEFNRNVHELLSRNISHRQAGDIIRRANTSGYWDNFGSITGMVIARAIDQHLGRKALSQTIESGPLKFLNTYVDLMYRNSDLPPLSGEILDLLGRSHY